MDTFLQSIEQRAYRMVHLAVGGHADAIDILQESMLKLVLKYQDKPEEQWKPLFYKILQNRIRDWQRQQKVKNMLFFWRSSDANDEDDWQPEAVDDKSPEQAMDKQQMQQTVIQALHGLPEKQQQCFLLRSWEGLSVAETAEAMGCSQGSVKTHYFRAVHKLKDILGEAHDVII